MTQTFMPNISTEEELLALQLDGLRWTVHHSYENSPFYRQRLQKANITPDDINSMDDLLRLPFITANDLREEYPFPLRAAPFDQFFLFTWFYEVCPRSGPQSPPEF